MECDADRSGLVAVATISKKAVNQDSCDAVVNRTCPLSAVVVADGVGSHFAAEVAATVVIESLAEDLRAIDRPANLHLARMFANAHARLRARVDADVENLPSDLDWNNAFGTTAVCAVDTPGMLTLAYAGNGGLFHIRGNFNTFPSSQLLPWSAVNYLNPHSVPRDGRNAMYKFISPRSSADDVAPTVVTISKDDACFGDIVLCCTDGIYSYDQTSIGRDDRGQLWISGEASMARFYASLASFFDGDPSIGTLEATLDRYLAALESDGLVSDDCTIGVLITARALAFQSQLREKRMDGVSA